jgi:hypothetical protein
MKLKVNRQGILGINCIDLDKLKTDIKWVDVEKDYYLEFEEKEGFLEPVALHDKPAGLCVIVRFEVIYKSYALTYFNFGKFEGKDSIDADIRDYKFVLKD